MEGARASIWLTRVSASGAWMGWGPSSALSTFLHGAAMEWSEKTDPETTFSSRSVLERERGRSPCSFWNSLQARGKQSWRPQERAL